MAPLFPDDVGKHCGLDKLNTSLYSEENLLMENASSGKMMWIVAALTVGGIIGYVLKGTPSSSPSQPYLQEKMQQAQKDSKEWKIQNAMSAAPDAVSKGARVMDWPEKEGAKPTELRQETNDWTCLPDYPASPGNDPICVDKAGMQWFEGYMVQKPPNLTQPGLGYMLQGGSDASNTDPFATKPKDGEDWVTAPAHVMVFPAGKLDPKVYGTDHKKGTSWIMFAGTPFEHLMIPVQ